MGGGVYSDIAEYKSDTSKLIGRHLLKFGASVATDNTNNSFYGAVDVFDPFQTSSGSAGVGGDSVASMLLGDPPMASSIQCTPFCMEARYTAHTLRINGK